MNKGQSDVTHCQRPSFILSILWQNKHSTHQHCVVLVWPDLLASDLFLFLKSDKRKCTIRYSGISLVLCGTLQGNTWRRIVYIPGIIKLLKSCLLLRSCRVEVYSCKILHQTIKHLRDVTFFLPQGREKDRLGLLENTAVFSNRKYLVLCVFSPREYASKFTTITTHLLLNPLYDTVTHCVHPLRTLGQSVLWRDLYFFQAELKMDDTPLDSISLL